MIFKVEGQPSVDSVGEAQLRTVLSKLRSYGPASFASLTDKAGDCLQLAGGVTCMIERREARTQRHFMAFQDKKSEAFADGTLLVSGGGIVKLRADEWFTAKVFKLCSLAFCAGPLCRMTFTGATSPKC